MTRPAAGRAIGFDASDHRGGQRGWRRWKRAWRRSQTPRFAWLPPWAAFRHYRCQRDFKGLVAWLRSKGSKSANPIHTMRKEFGSLLCERAGIYEASRALRHADIAITAQHYLDGKKRVTVGLGGLLHTATLQTLSCPVRRAGETLEIYGTMETRQFVDRWEFSGFRARDFDLFSLGLPRSRLPAVALVRGSPEAERLFAAARAARDARLTQIRELAKRARALVAPGRRYAGASEYHNGGSGPAELVFKAVAPDAAPSGSSADVPARTPDTCPVAATAHHRVAAVVQGATWLAAAGRQAVTGGRKRHPLPPFTFQPPTRRLTRDGQSAIAGFARASRRDPKGLRRP